MKPRWKVKCENCGKYFMVATRKRRYCSDACKQIAYRNRKKQQPLPLDWATAPIIRGGAR
jgi:predicted nucleic acid-binding Zn ribbon protein